MMFWHIFGQIFVKSLAVAPPCPVPTPPPFRLVLLLLQTTWGDKKSRQAVVHNLVQCQLAFQSVSGPGPFRVQSSQLSLLSRSFWVDLLVPLFWANSWNYSTLLRIWQIPGKQIYTWKKRGQKLSGPQCLTVLPDPCLIRVKRVKPLQLNTYHKPM
jgi:hypothetical protein